MFRTSIRSLIAGAAAAALLASGCAADGGGGDPNELSLLLWDTGPASVEAYNDLKERFEDDHPGVTVKIETANTNDYETLIKARLAGGAGPDIFAVRPQLTADLVTGGFLSPLSDLEWFSALNESAQNAPRAVQDGVAYAAPISQTGEGMLYNPTLFEQAGIEKVPTTFDELVDVSQVLLDAGITPIGMSAADDFWPQFILYHLTAEQVEDGANDALMSGETTFAENAGWRGVLEDYQTLIPYFMPNPLGTTQQASQAAFLQGNVAMWPTIGILPDVRGAGLEVGYFGFPGSNLDTDRLWGSYPMQLGINPKNGRTELAQDFLALLFSPEVYPGFLSTIKSYPVIDGTEIEEIDPLSPTMQADWEGQTFVPSPPDFWLPGVQQAMLSSVQELTAERVSVDDVLAAMDAATDKALG